MSDPVEVTVYVAWGEGQKIVTITGRSVSVKGELYPRELHAVDVLSKAVGEAVRELKSSAKEGAIR